jgi:hypothetical protein
VNSYNCACEKLQSALNCQLSFDKLPTVKKMQISKNKLISLLTNVNRVVTIFIWRGLSWRKHLLIMESIASLFFLSLLSLSNFSSPAFATSFGPIPLTEQLRSAQYFVHGKILSPGSAAIEPTQKVPFTYWKFSLIDQPLGAPLPAGFDIREAGGEVGAMGYHRAGSATFHEGEEVFVALKDTDDESQVKEVIGLSSGKYTVAEDSKSILSGLGPTILGADNAPLSVEEFTQVARRVASGRETASDKTIFVNRAPGPQSPDQEHEHADDPVLAEAEKEATRIAQAKEAASILAGENNMLKGAAPKSGNAANSFKTDTQEPEKLPSGTSKGFWWIFALVAFALLAAGIAIFRR